MGDFLATMNGWGIPTLLLIILGMTFLISQVIGEVIELLGKTAPTILKIRKYFAEKKEQRKQIAATLADVQASQAEIKTFLADVKQHYDEDNIAKRDKWMVSVNTKMKWVDDRAKVYDAAIDKLLALEGTVKEQITKAEANGDKLDLTMEMTSQMYKDSCRNRILDFAHNIVNARRRGTPVTYSREEFKKIRRIHSDYEAFLEKFGGTNGEVDDAMIVIRRAEAGEYENIEFLEDMRD